jgi:hypothetical protein
MSHLTDIDIEIRDIEALKDACTELDLPVEKAGMARGYGEALHRAEYVIRLKGPYDIAVNRQADGRWTLSADLWNGHVEREVGPKFGRLRQFYGVHRTLREAQRIGLKARRSVLQDGTVRLALCRV